LLGIFGIDESHFEQLTDGTTWQDSENELLWKILVRFPSFRTEEMEEWASHSPSPEALTEKPAEHRAVACQLRGRVVKVEPLKPLPEFAARSQLPEYYRCELLLDGNAAQAVVFSPTIPKAWKGRRSLDERAAALALFLKTGESAEGKRTMYFAAPRIAWYPATPLGDLGMDVGLLDDFRPSAADKDHDFADVAAGHLEQFRLTESNREAFYQMLAAVGRAKAGQLERLAAEELRRRGEKDYSVVPLFNDPLNQQGRIVRLAGTAREIVEVRVGDADIQRRFGIDRYYQISLFTGDSQGNPIIFCVRQLPPGLTTGGGPQFAKRLVIAGFFFNAWAYRSRERDEGQRQASKWQLAPLLIGREPVLLAAPPVDPWRSLWPAMIVVLLLAVVAFSLWRFRRQDRRQRRSTEADPDFSGLE
jgi:hypothetical protein